MLSPVVWFEAAQNFWSAHIWFNWTLFVLGLLATGFLLAASDARGRVHPGGALGGVFLSAVAAFAWPLAIGAIPIVLCIGAIAFVVLLPKWVMDWHRIYKTEKAAKVAMAKAVDKT